MIETIKNRVQEERTKLLLTQEELAFRVDVTRQTIIAIEKGNYTPSLLLAMRLSKVFDLSIEKIFTLK